MNLVLNRDNDVKLFLDGFFPDFQPDSDFVGIGLADGEEMVAGCVYQNFRGHDIEMVFAAKSPRWATRSNISRFFDYPFLQLGCSRVTAIVLKSNRKSRKFIEGVGFKLEGVARKGFDGIQDACIYGLLRSEVNKFFEVKNGREKRTLSTTSS